MLILVTLSCSIKSSVSELENWTLGPFIRPAKLNPIISPDSSSVFFDPISNKRIKWEANDTFNPAAAVKDDSIYVVYRAEDKSGVGIGERTSRLGIASSADGLTMKRHSEPILFPGNDSEKEMEWPGGCEDPRTAVTGDGTYVMFYTQWNKKVPRLAVATSKDLKRWDKHGPVFKKAFDGRFFDLASKSASIVTKVTNGKQIITKVNGEYLMYWGEKFINLATSTDLINWKPLLNPNGELAEIVSPRRGFFDSELTECGPPAVLVDKGILLMYNGKNSAGKFGDKRYTANTYAAGQVLFDAETPARILKRLDKPFLVPTEPFEKSGQYPAGTVFIEGLVYFKDKWFLYYGCADSRVAVAVYNPGESN